MEPNKCLRSDYIIVPLSRLAAGGKKIGGKMKKGKEKRSYIKDGETGLKNASKCTIYTPDLHFNDF